MTTMASKFSAATTKFQVGVAACAVAAAASLTPAIAEATPALPAPSSPVTQLLATGPILSPANISNIAQSTGWIWWGPTRPDGPALTPIITFFPLNLVPGFLQPLFGWFKNIKFTMCFFGLNVRIGPYGTISAGFSRGC
jgi:hypothetical protein